MRQGMLLTAIAVGLARSAVAAKYSSSLLYGVRPHDLATFLTCRFCCLVLRSWPVGSRRGVHRVSIRKPRFATNSLFTRNVRGRRHL
jgi:hypothetical protein